MLALCDAADWFEVEVPAGQILRVTLVAPGEVPTLEARSVDDQVLALGNGGPWGVGLGNGVEKFGTLTFAHIDFIFPVVGEELLRPMVANMGAGRKVVQQLGQQGRCSRFRKWCSKLEGCLD